MSVSVPDTDTDNFLKSENGLSGSEENRKSVKKCPSIRPMTFGIEITSKVDKMARMSSQLSKGYEF